MSLKSSNRFCKILYGILVPLISVLFIESCARITALEGGPKDTVPPQLIKTCPTQEGTGFQGKTIKLVFDKAIEVQDIHNQLVVTPRLPKLKDKPSYMYNVRGNTLKLILQVPLEEKTTYTFNFNDAIKDTTEGNIAEHIALTFSTGDDIDTMYVTGQVKHLMTGQPASKVRVSLYKANNAQHNILNSPPDYSIKTDTTGKFKLAYVAKGQYHIYAGTHKENQLTIDPGKDEYGFLKDPIDLTTTSVDDVVLPILEADIRAFKLQSQQLQNQYFELRFNKPVVDYTLTLVKKFEALKKEAIVLYSNLVEEKQVIRVYNTLGLLAEDSIEAHLTAKDVLGTIIEETVTLRFREGKRQSVPASYTLHPSSGATIRSAFVGTMTVDQPVQAIVADRLAFVLNGLDETKIIKVDTQDLKLNAQKDIIIITKQLDIGVPTQQTTENATHEPVDEVILQMAEGAFVTVEGGGSKAMRYIYTLENPREWGTIKGKVTTEAPGFIVQLLDMEYKVIDSIKNEHNYQFKEVAPGSYRLRLLVLQDKEGDWRFGNIHKRQEPDPVVVYPANVAVIANWEIEGIDFVF